MIVDDDKGSIKYLSKIFDVWKVENKDFTSSLNALEYIRKNPKEFSLYIFDFKMPDLNGFESAKKVREQITIVLQHLYKKLYLDLNYTII
jgi:two-component SAPR family response regulator